MKKLLLLLLMGVALHVYAQQDELKFRMESPEVVAVGDQFRVSYVVYTKDINGTGTTNHATIRARLKDLTTNFADTDGIEVLVGPTFSQGSSMTTKEGVASTQYTVTYTFILRALRKGRITIPAARITIDGKQVATNSKQITVVPPTTPENEIIIHATLSRDRNTTNAPFILTYKIYTVVDIVRVENWKLPDFNGLSVKRVGSSLEDNNWKSETYNGINYQTCDLVTFQLTPQPKEVFTFKPTVFEIITRKIKKTTTPTDPFDAFFSGASVETEDVKRTITVDALQIHI